MSFSVSPIGGVGQIGSNMLLVQNQSESIIIDCGILFPYEDSFDIRYLIPNFKEIERPKAVIITHGHEDHIGALGHLVEKFPDITIYAPAFAASLIRRKLDFFPRELKYKLRSDITKTITLIELEFSYIQVNHSIPDTFGIHINDLERNNSLFYVSDFKVDKKAEWEPYFDFNKLQQVSKNIPHRVLMADSTNATSKVRRTPSETDLIPAMDHIMNQAHRRIFVTTFSSNVHRIKNLIIAARKSGRKVVLYGRSLKNYFEVGVENKIVCDEREMNYDVEQINKDYDKLLVIVSGCQGDFKSTFRRIAFAQDAHFEPQSGDLFVLSSKSIPGNEKKISLCLNEISNRGAKITTSSDLLIHASGHAGVEDIEDVVKSYHPTVFIPIHGEGFFLERHETFINTEFKTIKTINIRNHDIYDLASAKKKNAKVQLEPIIIYGKALEFSKDSIRERRKMATTGCIFISIIQNKSILLEDAISFQGITFQDKAEQERIQKNIQRIITKNYSTNKDYKEPVRIEVRRLINNLLGFKPVVLIHSLKMG